MQDMHKWLDSNDPNKPNFIEMAIARSLVRVECGEEERQPLTSEEEAAVEEIRA